MKLYSAGRQVLAQELNLKLGAGQINVIVGPNGTGKSSLLRALFGELRPDHGRIVLDGDAQSGYVFVTDDLKTARKAKVTVTGISHDHVMVSSGLENAEALNTSCV